MRKLSRILALALVMIIAVSMMTMFAFEASAATTRTIYFKPNTSYWDQANAVFYAWTWGGSSADEWVKFEKTSVNGIYSAVIPSDRTGMKLRRFNPSDTSAPHWNSAWNETGDLTITSSKNMFTMSSWSGGSWSYYCNNNHTWNSGTVTKAATCSATGTMKYTCTKCSATKNEAIEKIAHSFSGASCTVCGTANPDYCAHSSKTEVNTATCTTAGKHYFDCDNCDEIFDETSVDALGHNYVNGVCSRCDLIITYFVNSAKWENVSAHMWIEGGAGTTWPGNAMTKTGDTVNGFDVYYIESATAYANIIFNNNNAGSQTADLKLAPGQYYNLSDNTWYGSIGDIPEIDHLATGNFLVGSFNGWNTTLNEFKLDKEGGSTSYVSIELEEGAKIEFKVMFDGAWYGSNTAFTSETASGDFSNSVSGNATLTALCKGTYVFALTDKTLKVTFVSHTPGAAADCENAQVCTVCGTQLADKLGHNIVVDKAVDATCLNTGLTAGEHCTRCDYKVAQKVVDALGHDLVGVSGKAADCLNDGYTAYKDCSRCDYIEGKETISALGHDMVTDKAVAPDCLNTGLTEGSHCSRCDHKVAQEVVDALGHDYKAVVTAPTFDAEGYTTHTCSRCSDSYKDSYVNALVAVATVNGVRYETLTEAIAVGGEIILLEDVVLEGSLVIPAGKVVTLNLDGHTISQSKECVGSYSMIENKGTLVITGNGKISFADTSAGDPTFGWGSYTIYNTGTLVVENGTIEHLGEQAFATHMICAIFQYSGSTTINGGVISTPAYRSVRLWMGEMVINGGEFDGQLWVQSVDSTSKLTINGGTFGPNGRDGSSVFVDCGSNNTVEFKVTGGNFTTKIGCNDATRLTGDRIIGGSFSAAAVSGTNSALIAEGYIFNENGNVIKEVHQHSYNKVVTAPTCLEEGYTTYTCDCGDEYVSDKVDALGHDMVTDKAVAPDCLNTGLTEGSHCSRCDHKVAQEVVKALGHTEVVDKAVAATCTTSGLTEGKHCSVCNEVLVAQTEVKALGHTEVVDKAVAPTCTATGLTEGKHCSVCKEVFVKQEVVEKVAHTPADAVVENKVEATCKAEGSYDSVVKCSVCSAELSRERKTISKLAHTEVTIPATAATCTSTGLTEGKKCSVCQTVIVPQTTIDALGHTEEIIPGTAATCTSTGLSEGKKCSVCEEILVAQNEIAKLEHTFVNGECACGEQDPHYTNPTTPNPEDEFESDNIIVKILKFILMLFKTFRAFFGSF